VSSSRGSPNDPLGHSLRHDSESFRKQLRALQSRSVVESVSSRSVISRSDRAPRRKSRGHSTPPTAPEGFDREARSSSLGVSARDRMIRRSIGLLVAMLAIVWASDFLDAPAFRAFLDSLLFSQPSASAQSSKTFSSIDVLDPRRIESMLSSLFSSLVPLAIFVAGIIFVIKSIRVVPQQRAFVVERLGRFHAVLEPGLRFTIPFIDRISARHDLREVPLDVPSQVCITRDNTQLQVDGILYYQVTDPKLATYGSSNYIMAITQLAQTTLRSVVGRLELDKTFEEREMINHAVVSALDEAAMNWGVKVLRYEIKDLTPPKEILHAMQQQITAEREKRALIAASEGRKQEQINIAMGQKEAAIAKSEGDKISEINQAQGEAAAILAKAEASAEAIRKIAAAIESQGGLQAVNLKVAEQYVAAFSAIAKQGNTIVVPQNLTDIAALVTAATSVLKAQK